MRNLTILLLLGTSSVLAGDSGVSYKYQGQDWVGTCSSGKKQSPIDIPTGALNFFNTSSLYNTFLNTASSIMKSSSSGSHRVLQDGTILAASQ